MHPKTRCTTKPAARCPSPIRAGRRLRHLVASSLQDVIHLRHLVASGSDLSWWRFNGDPSSIKSFSPCTQEEKQKEGGCVWSLPEIWSIRYVASLSTIWSIFSGDLVASIFSSDLVLADGREMDILPI
ncbi:hypothetical protein L6452_24190 [Arctium lappa]|uniref:Uncharacterized protein n=1 Tax=Arctium lappa TaxID=4217 RepID=A0ACB9A8J0_ARCLA|nr:hypothetical protein L6452_24190 [Arctium lappa]